MDKDKAKRTLLEWFPDRPFSVKCITDDRLPVIAELVGISTKTTQGMRKHLGRRLTAMAADGYQCSTAPDLGATLTAKRIPEHIDSRPEVYWIEQR